MVLEPCAAVLAPTEDFHDVERGKMFGLNVNLTVCVVWLNYGGKTWQLETKYSRK